MKNKNNNNNNNNNNNKNKNKKYLAFIYFKRGSQPSWHQYRSLRLNVPSRP